MANGVQMQEQLGLHHWSGRNDLVHLLARGHGRRVLQHVERTPTQRLECPLCQDLGEHMIRVCEVTCEECGKWSEALVHRLAHLSNDDCIALGHGGIRGMHEYMLKRFLHGRGALCSGFTDEPRDRRVLESRLLHVQLEVLEVFVGSIGDHSHVLFEIVAVLFP